MLTRLAWMGAVGSALVAVSSWWVGAVPHSFQDNPPGYIDWLPVSGAAPRGVYYIGLAALMGAWILLGRAAMSSATEIPRRSLYVLAGAWALPLLAAMPVGSRDLWAYAAQGNLDHHGLDPYAHSPADLPGVFQDNVSIRWIHATTPYGPLWLLIGRAVSVLTGSHVQVAVFVLRLPIVIGFVLMLWTVPRLAVRAGARTDMAVWFAVLNPVTLVLGLAGGHNDLLMTGLMAVGALFAVTPGPMLRTLAPAAALMAAAAAIKSPAAIGAAFVVPLWLHYQPGQPGEQRLRRALTATGAALLSSLAAFAIVSLVGGHGLGWVKQINSSAPIVSWMSLPTAAAMLVKVSGGHTDGGMTLDSAMEHWRSAGLVLAGVLIAAGWLISTLRETYQRAGRTEAFAWFTAALLVIIVLGPSVQPWYFVWALPFGAMLTMGRRAVGVAITLSVWFVLMIRPLGTGLQMDPLLPAVLAVSIAVGGLAVWRWPAAAPVAAEPVGLRRRS